MAILFHLNLNLIFVNVGKTILDKSTCSAALLDLNTLPLHCPSTAPPLPLRCLSSQQHLDHKTNFTLLSDVVQPYNWPCTLRNVWTSRPRH